MRRLGLAGGSEVEGRWRAPKDAAIGGDDLELLIGLHGDGPARSMDEGVVAATEEPHVVDVGGAVVSVVLADVMGLAARRLVVQPGNAQCRSRAMRARHCRGVAVRTVRDIHSGSWCWPSWMKLSFASHSKRRTRSDATVVPSV